MTKLDTETYTDPASDSLIDVRGTFFDRMMNKLERMPVKATCYDASHKGSDLRSGQERQGCEYHVDGNTMSAQSTMWDGETWYPRGAVISGLTHVIFQKH